MNVLFISKGLPPAVDGVGDYTINIAREFSSHGHSVTIVCKKAEDVITDYANITVLPVVEAWNNNNGKRIRQLINERNIDVTMLQYVPHAFEPHGLPFGLLSFVQQIKKSNKPVFTFLHEVYWRYRGG